VCVRLPHLALTSLLPPCQPTAPPAPLPSGPLFSLSEFENSAFNVGDSLKTLGNGVCLSCLVNAGKLELHYSEFGVGGGQEGNGNVSSLVAVVAAVCACVVWK
jgi:hypothetical protein